MVLTFRALVILTVSGWVFADHITERFHYEKENIFYAPCRGTSMNPVECLPLNDCPHLRERAEEGNNREIASIIEEFGCGFQTVVHVCCTEKNDKPKRDFPVLSHHTSHPLYVHDEIFHVSEISNFRPLWEHSFGESDVAEDIHPDKKVPDWRDTPEGLSSQGNFGQNFQSGKPHQGGFSNNGWNQDSFSSMQTGYQGFSGGNRPNNPEFIGGHSSSSFNNERPSSFGSGPSYHDQGISEGNEPLNQGFGVSGSISRPTYQGYNNERPSQSGLGNQRPQQFSSSINERPSHASFGTNRPGVQNFGNGRPGNTGLNRPDNYDIDYGRPSPNVNRPSSGRPGSKRPTNQGNYNENNSFGSASITSGATNNQRPNYEGSKKRPNSGGSNKKKPSRRLLPDGNCGTEISDKIIGGEDTSLDEFPWMALLHFSTRSGQDRGFGCGGSLINERYVLTAAHCIKGPSLPQNTIVNTVRLGEYDITKERDCINGVCSPSPIDVAVEEIIVHPDYKPNDKGQHHDIALIRLRKKVDFNTYINPICIPGDELMSKDYSGKQLVVAGWGKTANGAKAKSSSTKQKVSLPFVTLENCKPFYDGINIRLRNTQMCAGGEKAKDSCQGDSGGPLMSNEIVNGQSSWFVTGIVSFGPEDCGVQNIAGVYTRVSQYVDWILENVKE